MFHQSSVHFGHSDAKLRDAIHFLVNLLVKNDDVGLFFMRRTKPLAETRQLVPMVQKIIRGRIAKLDTEIVTVALNELVLAATYGGFGSPRCEIVANTLKPDNLSSISVRGEILSKLRKVWFTLFHCICFSNIPSRPLGRRSFDQRRPR